MKLPDLTRKLLPNARNIRLFAIATLSLPVLLALTNLYVELMTRSQRYERASDVPARRVAIVFGAGVRPDGRLSPMLADRVRAAAELYSLGRVQKLLMTGDNSRVDYDEVSAMRQYAVEQGVRFEDITLDYAGFSTYDSCFRAGAIFGVKQAVLVTQHYHLPRAVYTCNQLNIDVVGLGTGDWGVYSDWVMVPYTLREALATLKALWFVHVTRPLPTFLGPHEQIA